MTFVAPDPLSQFADFQTSAPILGPAFQSGAFQKNAFQVLATEQAITDTTDIALPINAVLGDGTHELETKKRASPLEGLSGVMRSIFRE